MLCPSCSHDNIDGIDECDGCGLPLTEFDYSGSELEQSIVRHAISVLCPKTPVLIGVDNTIREVIAELVKHGIGCLLVHENDTLVGIVSERDVLNSFSTDPAQMDRKVSEVMTADPTSVFISESIAYALHLMDIGGFRHLPIVDEEGRPVGIISVRDILRFLCIRFGELRALDL
ncbi:MAG: hypothetical protein CMJ48_15005 [Planctomycetaceae bacterium]|nr:hypothetical protein [Planctomycetaceae bacterium]